MKTYRVRARKDAVPDVVVSSVSPVPVRHTDGVKHHGVHRGVLEKENNEPNVVKLGRACFVLTFKILIIYPGMHSLPFLIF